MTRTKNRPKNNISADVFWIFNDNGAQVDLTQGVIAAKAYNMLENRIGVRQLKLLVGISYFILLSPRNSEMILCINIIILS